MPSQSSGCVDPHILGSPGSRPGTRNEVSLGTREIEGLLCLVITALLVLPASTAVADDPPVWGLSPYQVRILIASDGSPGWPDVDELCESLPELAVRFVGGAWRLECLPASAELRRRVATVGLQYGGESREAAATAKFLAGENRGGEPHDGEHRPVAGPSADAGGQPVDKVILVSLRDDGAHRTLVARELDLAWRIWGPAIQQTHDGARPLARDVMRAAARAFCPTARLRKVEGDRVTIRSRVAGIPPIDKDLLPFRPGTAARVVGPVDGKATAVVPWTYLIVEEAGELDCVCRIVSRYQSPLQSLETASLDGWVALEARPPRAATRLQVTWTDKSVPLPGCEIFGSAVERDPGGPDEFLGRTDRAGRVTIASLPRGLRWLELRVGQAPLVRVPILPGLDRELELGLDLDAAGLQSLAAVARFDSQLAEALARRDLYQARIKQLADAGKSDEARQVTSQFEQWKRAERERLQAIVDREFAKEGSRLGPSRKQRLDEHLR